MIGYVTKMGWEMIKLNQHQQDLLLKIKQIGAAQNEPSVGCIKEIAQNRLIGVVTLQIS